MAQSDDFDTMRTDQMDNMDTPQQNDNSANDNPGNFKNDRKKAKEAGSESHKNDS